ncbi:MAG: signal recognition particle subunit SRP19/SEC65 family protein [Euryarchaeota archaeon]|nr:signal recognition particle subunit SRP19/SEC65 family protein [Euryarchaeota archaeon]
MAMDPEKAIVLYPAYFDIRLSRAKGRRVAKKDAIEAPSAQMLFSAVKSLDLDCILELEKSHPRFWYRSGGRVLVEPKLDKPQLMVKVAQKLKNTPRAKE